MRDWPFLPHNDPAYSELRARLTHLEKGWSLANMNAVLVLKQVYDDLNPYDQSLYRRALIVLDMEEEVAEQFRRLTERLGAAATSEQIAALIELPQGDGSEEQRWTPEKTAKQADWVRLQLGLTENAAVAHALDLRKMVFGQVLERLAAAKEAVTGRGPEFSRREWFHHMINDFAESERERRAAGTGRVRPVFQGMLLRREGSLLNYNTEDVAVEFGWLPGALYNCHVYEFMAWVRDRYDIKKELQKAALAINFERLMELLEAMASEINARERQGEPVTAADLYRSRYNQPIAAGFRQLGWLAREHPDWLPGSDDERWEAIIEALAANYDLRADAEAGGTPAPELDEESTRRFFQWLRWLLTPPQAGQAGSGAAAQLFKGLAEKRARIQQDLGKEYVTWRDLLRRPIAGYDFTDHEAWQPVEGTAFYGAFTVRDRIAQAVLEAEAAGTGLALNLSASDLRRVRVMGGRKPEWVVPKPVAQTLNSFKNPYQPVTPIGRLLGAAGSGWKQWTLLNPFHYVGYNLRNQLTDLEMLSFNPGARRYVGPATAMLTDFLWRRQLPAFDLREWLDWGGQVSTLQASQERPTGATLDMLDHLRTDRGLSDKTWRRVWNGMRIGTDWREAILRFAMYLSYRDQMLAAPDGRPDNFGASNRRDVMGIADLRLRAFVLSNDLMGPYDRVPQGYKIVRQHLPAPFLTWKIINTRRQMALWNNQVFEPLADWIVMKMPLAGGGGAGQPPALPPPGGGGPGAADAEEERRRRLQEWLGLRAEAKRRGLNWRWVAARLAFGSPLFLYFLARFLFKANLLNALAAGWNWAVHKDEEEHLPPWVRYRPHLDLGQLPGTKVYAYVDRTSGVGDAAAFFGVDNLPHFFQQWQAGRISIAEALREMLVQGPGQELYNQVGIPKTAMEFLLRRKGFPDIEQPREIQDRTQYAWDQLSLGKVWHSWVMNRPAHLGKLSVVAQMAGVSLFHPGETAYGEMRETAGNWAKDHGFGDAHSAGDTDRAQMGYWVRRAMKVGDEDAVRHFLLLYWKLGGTDDTFAASVKLTYPLYKWPEKQRREFLLSLKGGEVERWRNSLWFLQQTYVPDMKVSPEERARHQHEPIERFDAWLWGRIESGIDRGGLFKGYETAHPAEFAERRKKEKALGR